MYPNVNWNCESDKKLNLTKIYVSALNKVNIQKYLATQIQ